MIGHTIIYNNELATLPLIGASVGIHKGLKLLDKLRGNLRAVAKPHSLAIAVPLINPSRIGGKDLVIECFASIGAFTDGWQHL